MDPSDTNSNGIHRMPPKERARDQEEHTLSISRRRGVMLGLVVVAAIAGLYVLAPQIAGFDETWQRLNDGDPRWLGVAVALTVAMFIGYAFTFNSVFQEAELRLSDALTICMAALAASRLFAAAGAGGIVLQAWALRRRGMAPGRVADLTVSFIVIQYLFYTVAVIVFGFGLHYGVFPGPAPWAMTFLPATAALCVTVVGLSAAFVPPNLERRMAGWAQRGASGSRARRLLARAAVMPQTVSVGTRDALAHVRACDGAVVGAAVFWTAQIAALAACFEAFGDAPPVAVLVVGFFVGMLGNLLPLPGGIGGVDGGMFAAFAAFGVDLGTTAVAVLAYRAFTFWLPTIPGVLAYVRLRRLVAGWPRR